VTLKKSWIRYFDFSCEPTMNLPVASPPDDYASRILISGFILGSGG
jgi:hypothetical protein